MSTVQQSVQSSVESVASTTEHSFQVVNKRLQGRRGGSRERGPSRNHLAHIPLVDETTQVSVPPRKKSQTAHKDKETRPRQSNHRVKEGVHKDSFKPAHPSSSSRGKNGDSGHHHHTNRHRNGNSSADSMGKPGSKITSTNRFEKLDSDVEHEVSTSNTSLASSNSGENFNKSSSSTSAYLSTSASSGSTSSKGSGEKKLIKDRNGRCGKGIPRSKGPTKQQTGDHNDEGTAALKSSSGHSFSGESRKEENAVKDLVKADGAQKKKHVKHIKFDLSPTFEVIPPIGDIEQSESGEHVSETEQDTGPSISSGEENVTNKETLGVSSMEGDGDVTKGLQAVSSTEQPKRLVYGRDALLGIRLLASCKTVPPNLDMFELFSQVSAPPTSVSPAPQNEHTESTEESRPKHPTALTLIREHDKLLSRVSLSPQRRSFQRGCSWKDNSSDPTLKTSSPRSNAVDNLKFDGHKVQGRQHTQGPSHSHVSHTPRVIHHVPLHDQEQKGWRQAGKEGNWKYQTSSKSGHHYMSKEEPEPEWMEFGPTDRYDIIELKGFDEHEMEREARKDSGSSSVEETIKGCDTKENPARKEQEAIKYNSADILDVNEEKEEPHDQPDEELPVRDAWPQNKSSVQEENVLENEYILDGFDFSTGVSICQELALDEEEGVSTDSLLFTHGDPSNVLMKALGVGKDKERVEVKPQNHRDTTAANNNTGTSLMAARSGVQPPPVNALTLDEIHARENIQPTPSQEPSSVSSGEGGMGAFNKLLAAMQSKQQEMSNQKPVQENYIPDTPGYPISQKYSTVVPANQSNPQQLMQVPRTEKHVSRVSPRNYGYLLEKELLDLEDDLPVPNIPFPDHLTEGIPNLRRLEQLEQMLERMDRMDPTAAQFQGYPNMPPPHHPHHHHHQVHQMDHHIPMTHPPMDRDGGRGWMYLDRGMRQVDRTRPTPQQLAAAKQHQMLTSTRNANNWAVEMERRRVMELRQMELAKEKEQQLYGSGTSLHGFTRKATSSKPNISLLPTAVMRHIHSSKPAHQSTEMPKTSLANRLDQDLTNKASQTHSMLNSLLNHGAEDYPLQFPHHTTPMHRMNRPDQPLPPTGMMYPHYNVPISHGMPVQNPYLY